ncbi:hypothetical protein P7K49_005847 [Saguinus oedipus]|uniref:Uncharacterized protein n=1 Tax=Saguinus oedipus TaxID=9490 RepID=A0ABQ9W1I0_SAGOE|nr:hypothetical protein P7K49_005847 [Saguinus oedipus]
MPLPTGPKQLHASSLPGHGLWAGKCGWREGTQPQNQPRGPVCATPASPRRGTLPLHRMSQSRLPAPSPQPSHWAALRRPWAPKGSGLICSSHELTSVNTARKHINLYPNPATLLHAASQKGEGMPQRRLQLRAGGPLSTHARAAHIMA